MRSTCAGYLRPTDLLQRERRRRRRSRGGEGGGGGGEGEEKGEEEKTTMERGNILVAPPRVCGVEKIRQFLYLDK